MLGNLDAAARARLKQRIDVSPPRAPRKKRATPVAMARGVGRPAGRAGKAPSEPGPASVAAAQPRSASQKDRDDKESEAFWAEFAKDAAAHAAKSEKAAKIIRDTVITRKAAGRAVPTKVTYQRSTTVSSDVPLKKPKVRGK